MPQHLSRREFLALTGAGLTLQILGTVSRAQAQKSRPNILLMLAEDIGPDLQCYGVGEVQTPHLDRLAAEGMRYTQAFCVAPVCSPSRTALLTGVYPYTIRAQHHRVHTPHPLPPGVQPITHYLRAAGYYTAVGCGYSDKVDVNFLARDLFDGRDWSLRRRDQPFFAQITFKNTHRSWKGDPVQPVDPEVLEIPPYYPDHPLVRRDWARYLEEIQKMDRMVGAVLRRLQDEGLAENTLVIFTADNGRAHVRGKQFLYDEGIHVPLIVRWPERLRPGVSHRLISNIDIPAAILAAAGMPVPSYFAGHDFLHEQAQPREIIFAGRDRTDRTHDAIRAVRSHDFKYILNLMPERAWCQYNEYKERKYPALALMNVMNLEGELPPHQARFMAARKPVEELYDLRNDPFELHNVAGNPRYLPVLLEMRQRLGFWRLGQGDGAVSRAYREGGWPAVYPTRSLAEWRRILAAWEEHLYYGRAHPNVTPSRIILAARRKKRG
ncbi:MAG: sulfatase [Caldilineae bacterium]|nr:MAG: sulfatase [Caldilineae bacterium]